MLNEIIKNVIMHSSTVSRWLKMHQWLFSSIYQEGEDKDILTSLVKEQEYKLSSNDIKIIMSLSMMHKCSQKTNQSVFSCISYSLLNDRLNSHFLMIYLAAWCKENENILNCHLHSSQNHATEKHLKHP